MHLAFFLAVSALLPLPREFHPLPGERECSSVEIGRAVAAFTIDAALPAEGYCLTVDKSGVTVRAADAAGAFYAGQTLRQLAACGRVPCCRIVDSPKFSWRGLHLDESRHFFGKSAVLRLLETMAMFKLNVLHWHLTDNQGWRIPIPGWPQLTQTVRKVENRRNFCDRTTEGTYGPYAYTREELEEVVRRAAELQIRVVPEVEIPGHSETVLRACPEFACSVSPRRVDNAVCVGKDATIRFYEKVLDEVCDIFPGEIVHIGGDECDRSDWSRCPDCRARMAREGLDDVAGLQSWTTAHFERYLASKGRRLMGWDEIAEGGLPPRTMVMSWRGTSTGITAAKNGQDVVMTPTEYCYFDYDQCLRGDPQRYPYNWTVLLPVAKVYQFDPLRGLPAECRHHVLGGQGNNWSEMSPTAEGLEWKIWPRALAMAEVLWRYPEKRDFREFRKRAELVRQRLVDSGVNAAPVSVQTAGDGTGTLTHERTPDGETVRYAHQDAAWTLSLVSGKLFIEGVGQKRRAFDRSFDGPLDILDMGEGVFLVTVRRTKRESVVTVLFDGSRVVVKDRSEALPDLVK